MIHQSDRRSTIKRADVRLPGERASAFRDEAFEEMGFSSGEKFLRLLFWNFPAGFSALSRSVAPRRNRGFCSREGCRKYCEIGLVRPEAGRTIMRGTVDPERDRQEDHQISQDECGFLQRLFRRARDRQSRGYARRAQAANFAATARSAGAVRTRNQLERRRPPVQS